MLCRVGLVKTDVSEESIVSIIRVKRICEESQSASVANYCQSFFQLADCFHPDYGCDTFIRNVGFYKTYTAFHTTEFFVVTAVKT
jgi:hypothetical protein